ncbi:MAG: chemotaxis protein CheA [Armatimonadota bacterium]
MSIVDEGIVQKFRRIAADIAGLDRSNQEGIVRVGAVMEQAISEIPEDMSRLRELLTLGLEGLQVLYEGSHTDPDALFAAIAQGVTSVLNYLANEAGPEEDSAVNTALSVMLTQLGRQADDVSQEIPKPSTDLSLDDVAASLIQLDPSDSDGASAVADALKVIIADGSYNDSVKEKLSEAVYLLDAIAEGGDTDPAEALENTGSLIESAMSLIEDPALVVSAQSSSQPSPKSEPVPAPKPTSEVSTAAAPSVSAAQAEMLPPDSDPDLIGEFITECREYITGAEAALLTIETDPEDSEAVNTVFRAFHTIKGTSAFLGLDRISELAHKAESLLSRVRDHEISCTGGYADLSLKSIDMLKDLLQGVQDALGGEPMPVPEEYDQLIEFLTNPEANGVSGESEATAVPRLGDILVAEGVTDRKDVECAAASQGARPIGEAVVRSESASVTEVAKALRTQQKIASSESSVESSVRVRTDRLDRLIDMVGELVIAQSMVAQDETVILEGHHELSKKVTHMGKIVRDLQYLSMSMRMVPLKATFQKMARLVRDVAKKSGKIVEFTTDGDDTEIDRNMVDIINDPLVHMVRNAVDHGVEAPDVRESIGKSRTGKVRLMAYHSGGNVVVEMQDDGKGLDRSKIVEKAVAKGLIDSDKGMSDGEVFNLIFEPGFSTADKVTDISGRGVGLDVVKKNVEVIRGRIEIVSELGNGCTFIMRLPLTLAVTDGMLVRVGEERFIVPTLNIHKSFQPDREALTTVTGRGEMVMLRGELMPIFRLHRLFHIKGAIEDPIKGLLMILDDGERRCALLVDELLGQQHVVAKSLGEGIGTIPGISGGAILGDGRVGLILDSSEITALARQTTSGGNEAVCKKAA